MAVLVLIGGYYWYTNSDAYIAKHGKTKYVEGPFGGQIKIEHAGRRIVLDRKTEGEITSLGSGWSQYISNELGLTFQFPSEWNITEQTHNTLATGREGQASVRVEGDGYLIDFTNKGTEYPGGVDTHMTTRTVADQNARVFEDVTGEGFMMSIFDACDVAINISSPVSSMQITDKIINSVHCSMQ